MEFVHKKCFVHSNAILQQATSFELKMNKPGNCEDAGVNPAIKKIAYLPSGKNLNIIYIFQFLNFKISIV